MTTSCVSVAAAICSDTVTMRAAVGCKRLLGCTLLSHNCGETLGSDPGTTGEHKRQAGKRDATDQGQPNDRLVPMHAGELADGSQPQNQNGT